MNQHDEFMEMENYKTACGTLWPDTKKVEALIKSKGSKKRMRHKKTAVLIAACTGIFACSIVGTAAAEHFQIRIFADGKIIQSAAEMEKKEDGYMIHVKEGKKTEREMSIAEELGVYVITHADHDKVGLVLGENEIDITDDLQETGEYKEMWENEGKTYLVEVTDGSPEPTVTVTEQ